MPLLRAKMACAGRELYRVFLMAARVESQPRLDRMGCLGFAPAKVVFECNCDGKGFIWLNIELKKSAVVFK